jgi:uncharacterized membrane protein YdbT with pleckstrin-like domain
VCGEPLDAEAPPEPAEAKAEPAAAPSGEQAEASSGESGRPFPPRAEREDAGSGTLWEGRYALRDMNVVWGGLVLVTALFVALGAWVAMSGWIPGWLPTPVFWGVILLMPVVLWIYQGAIALHRSTIHYRLTPHRLYCREGILVRREEALELLAIEDMSNTQTVVQRFLCGGVGVVHVHSKDPSDPDLKLRGLVDYREAFEKIDQARRRERQKRGLALI